MARYRSILLGACSLFVCAPAFAQEVTPAETPPEASGENDIVITGSRIVRNGNDAPTPVTVASKEELSATSPQNIPDGLNKLPVFSGSSTPDKGGHSTIATPSANGNYLNLRRLGIIRTLILLDGLRVPPTNFEGTVDVDVIPELLVQRVDVVTAGASATYGSDAMTGVVNYVLDKNFTGFRGLAQSGVSGYGDWGNFRVGAAAGIKITDRLRVLLSVERSENKGFPRSARGYLMDPIYHSVGSVVGSTAAAGTAANPFMTASNVRYSNSTPGGLVTSGPFSGITFTTPGVYRAVNRGTATGTPFHFLGGDYWSALTNMTGSTPFKNTTAFGRIEYKVTDNVSVYGLATAADFRQRYTGISNFMIPQVIFSGNAYLPAALQTQLGATPQFNLAKVAQDMPSMDNYDRTFNFISVVGLKGKIGGWSFDLSYERGFARQRVSAYNVIENLKLAAAADAVVGPGGRIVCRPSLSTDPVVAARYANCVPINLFGFGAPTPEAIAYVTGVSEYESRATMDNFSGSISGELFDLGAGPIGVAVGAEYRRQSLNVTSNGDPAIRQDITGLRGISAGTTRFFLANVGVAKGTVKVKEAFGEIDIPLLRNRAFFKDLTINGAARVTNYSSSGTVTTWKVGVIWSPVADIRFRVTRSRDIRAPSLFELNAGPQTQSATIADVHTNTGGPLFQQTTSGNPNLKPEVGNTLTFGAVLQPRFLPGFSVSVDYYRIKFTNAIVSPTAASIINDCEVSNGTSPICSLIIRPFPFSDRSPANYLTALFIQPVNAALRDNRGIDFEASYRTDLGGGNLTLRVLGNYVISDKNQQSISQAIFNNAGVGVPKLIMTGMLGYATKSFDIFFTERYLGSGIRSNVATQTFAPGYDRLPVVWYSDLSLGWNVPSGRSDYRLFFTVNNLFNQKAPILPGTSGGVSGNFPTLDSYDTVGRRFTVGVKLNFK